MHLAQAIKRNAHWAQWPFFWHKV